VRCVGRDPGAACGPVRVSRIGACFLAGGDREESGRVASSPGLSKGGRVDGMLGGDNVKRWTVWRPLEAGGCAVRCAGACGLVWAGVGVEEREPLRCVVRDPGAACGPVRVSRG
jgi:hypothetical protein